MGTSETGERATILDAERGEHELPAAVAGDRLLVSAADLAGVIGWELQPEGLCRDDVCVPVRDRGALLRDGLMDLAELASVLRRPAVIDAPARVAGIGVPAATRAESLVALAAPDFELPDLDGVPFRFSRIGARKKLLHAWASW